MREEFGILYDWGFLMYLFAVELDSEVKDVLVHCGIRQRSTLKGFFTMMQCIQHSASWQTTFYLFIGYLRLG